MPINGTYGGNGDNVTDDGSLNGWADQAGNAYGNTIAFRRCYCFGPVVNNWGTWGQLVYDTPANLSGQDLASPTGLTGHMPANNAPDNSKWVQGHLVNGECGGDGGIAANLAPISHNVNMLHKGWEATLQRLVNTGPMLNSAIRMFNPNGIGNCRVIYRTHRLPAPAGTYLGLGPHPFATVPNGIAVSLGIVINGVMQSGLNVSIEFAAPANPRWFANHYYQQQAGATDRANIVAMIGGVSIAYL